MAISNAIVDREFNKFKENQQGETSVNVISQSIGSDGTPIGNINDAQKVYLINNQNSFCYAFLQAKASQTLDISTEVGSSANLVIGKKYTDFYAAINGTKLFQWKLSYIDDYGVSNNETIIGYGLTSPSVVNGEIKAKKRIIDTTGGTGIQRIVLFATPLDITDEITANIGFYENII